MPPRKATAEAKKTTIGADLIEGMKRILAHQRGKIELEQVWPRPIDVKAIRKQVKMSQAEFARTYNIGKRALQEWKQGGRQPDSAAHTFVWILSTNSIRYPASHQTRNRRDSAMATEQPVSPLIPASPTSHRDPDVSAAP